MKKSILIILLVFGFSGVLTAQNKRLKVAGNIQTDTLTAQKLLLSSGDSSKVMLGNGKSVAAGKGLSLANDSISLTKEYIQNILLSKLSNPEYLGTLRNSIVQLQTTNFLNTLEITTANNVVELSDSTQLVFVASSGNTLKLPLATGKAGKQIILKFTGTSGSNVISTPQTTLILNDGSENYNVELSTGFGGNYTTMIFVSNGTHWYIL